MIYESSPSSVMYEDFKDIGLKKSDVARILMDGQKSFGGGALIDRIDKPSQLTRYVIQVSPGDLGRGLFRDFAQSSQTIMGRLTAKLRDDGVEDPVREIEARYAGMSADCMQQALESFGADGNVYRNSINRIAGMGLDRVLDRAQLYLLLFIVAGCTGDPHDAAQEVEYFSQTNIGTLFRTTDACVDDYSSQMPSVLRIGLMRIVDGRVKAGSSLHQIPANEQGAEIGARASGPGAITDVDSDVSGHHARIYCQGGVWYIVGMGSLNGTTVISGADKIERVVEPPRKERQRGYACDPMEILPADTICLASSTRYLVMPLSGEDDV